MTKKMPTSLRHWEITREKGALKFILQFGLRWGLLMFLGTFYIPWRFSMFVMACTWAATGVVGGAFVWIISERQYKKFPTQKPEPTEA
jgi:hypothetical protein